MAGRSTKLHPEWRADQAGEAGDSARLLTKSHAVFAVASAGCVLTDGADAARLFRHPARAMANAKGSASHDSQADQRTWNGSVPVTTVGQRLRRTKRCSACQRTPPSSSSSGAGTTSPRQSGRATSLSGECARQVGKLTTDLQKLKRVRGRPAAHPPCPAALRRRGLRSPTCAEAYRRRRGDGRCPCPCQVSHSPLMGDAVDAGRSTAAPTTKYRPVPNILARTSSACEIPHACVFKDSESSP